MIYFFIIVTMIYFIRDLILYISFYEDRICDNFLQYLIPYVCVASIDH